MSRRRLRAEDLYRMHVLLSPTVSPDDAAIAYVVKRAEQDTGSSYVSEIHLISRSDGRMLFSDAGLPGAVNHSPRWSPDGSALAFLAPNEGADQLWIFDSKTGERSCMTRLEDGVQQYSWAGDSRRLVLSAAIREPATQEVGTDLQIITTIREKVRSQRMWEPMRSVCRQLVVLDLETRTCRQITQGPWDCLEPSWAPLSDDIAFMSNRAEDPDPMVMMDLWTIDARGGEATRLTNGRGLFGSPTWAPDGRSIAMIGCERGEHPTYQEFLRVWALDLRTFELQCLTADLDMTCSDCALTDVRKYGGFDPGALAWVPRDGRIYFIASTVGTTQVFSVDPRTRDITQVTRGAHEVYAFHVLAGERGCVVAASDPTEPGDLWEIADEGTSRRLTRVNPWLEEVELARLEHRTIHAEDGSDLDGWVMKPIGQESGSRYPAVVQVHRLMFANTFFFECQLMAASGFVVFYMNQHGSFGYGQDFAFAEYSDREVADLLAGAEMLGREPYVDPGRIGVCGGSNGGYLTFKLLVASDLFSAGVGQRGISNLTSMFGTSDIGYHHMEWIVGGVPWTHPDTYREVSPLFQVERLIAPLLILHSDRDTRVPIEQAEQLFIALKKLGRDVAFARFRNEGHDLSRTGKPRNRIARLEVILDWFHRHLS